MTLSPAPRVSVLVISFNRCEDLRLSLQAIFDTGYPDLEVIVVDNASADEAVAVARGFAGVKMVVNIENRGFAEANNQALDLATGDYVALINNDAVVAPDYFDLLVAFMETRPGCAAAGGKAYFWDDANPVFDQRNAYYGHTTVDPDTGANQAHTGVPDEIREVATLSGCAVMVRRSAIADVGGAFLEPFFFTYYEETDFFARAIRKGWKLYYTGEPAVWHRVRASTADRPHHYYFHMERNRILYAWRNFEPAELDHLRASLNKAIRRRRRKHPLAWRWPRSVERQAEQDAWRWYLGHMEFLDAERARVKGGDIPYNRAVRELESRARYYTHARPEVLALVPEASRIIVDIGCAAGALGRTLKLRDSGIQVRGVELTAEAAAVARGCLDDVVQGGAEIAMPAHWPEPDCLVFADVLEHLVDPWGVLKAWTAVLRPGGTVVISLPNAGHCSALGGLIAGRWDYLDAGVMDRTHLRFFTRSTAIALVTEAGLEVVGTRRVIEAPFRGGLHRKLRRWATRVAAREPKGGMGQGIRRFLLDYSTVQHLLLCRKPEVR